MTLVGSAIIALGDVLVDCLSDGPTPTSMAGGSALNVAVGLRMLGSDVALVGMVGDDDDGQIIRAHLADHDVPLVAGFAPHGTGRATSFRRDGEPTYAFNEAMLNRQLDVTPGVTRLAASARAVVVSGYPFDNDDEVEKLEQLLLSASGEIAIDPNPRAAMLVDRARYARNLIRIAAYTSLLKIGADDAQLVFENCLDVAAQTLVDAGAGVVLATGGSAGAWLYSPDETFHQEISIDDRPVVDTLGAGDATFSSVVHTMVGTRGQPNWTEMLDDAMHIAGETIRHSGGLLRLAPAERRTDPRDPTTAAAQR